MRTVPPGAVWRVSSRSSGAQQCVAVAHTVAVVGVRDSKNPDGPVLAFDRASWLSFNRNFKG
jgi:IMP cyclohydrolase